MSYRPIIEMIRAYCRINPRDDAEAIRLKVTGKVRALDGVLESALPSLLALLNQGQILLANSAGTPVKPGSPQLPCGRRLLLSRQEAQATTQTEFANGIKPR
jgi:hypothetical protein